jgi:CIC family chloride channel protein
MSTLFSRLWGLRQNQQVILHATAVAIGIVVAYGAIAFRELIDYTQILAFGFGGEDVASQARSAPRWRVMLAPVAGGLAVALMLRFIIKDGRPKGIADTIEAGAIHNARMPFFQGLATASLSAISMGSGASTGREGPIVHLGATLAAWFGERLGLTPALSRTLLGCGVATAVAASFNAPIAGVFFAMEVVLGHYAIHAFSPIVMASVVGTIITRAHLGNYPAFIIPDYSFASGWDIPVILLLGVICAFVSIGFLRACLMARDLFARLDQVPTWLHPVIGGVLLGIVALAFPEILGVGYEATDTALHGGFTLTLLLVLLALKIIMTSLSLGAGFGGGVFSPALFIGAMTGGAIGLIAGWVIPTTVASHGLFAIIGMGAVAGAVLGAPISTFLIVFELVGDYQLSIAIMVATMTASIITRQMGVPSFFYAQLEGRGLKLRGGRARHIVQTMQVGEVMRTNYRTIDPSENMDQVRVRITLSPHGMLMVLGEDGQFQGLITPDSLSKATENEDAAGLSAADVMQQPSKLLFTNDVLQKGLGAMDVTQEEYLPVLDNAGDNQLVGILSHRDALAAYNRVLLEEREEERGE